MNVLLSVTIINDIFLSRRHSLVEDTCFLMFVRKDLNGLTSQFLCHAEKPFWNALDFVLFHHILSHVPFRVTGTEGKQQNNCFILLIAFKDPRFHLIWWFQKETDRKIFLLCCAVGQMWQLHLLCKYLTMRLTLRNCSFNQSYENTIQSFFELCIFTSFCIWYPILFLRLLSDEQTKRGGF